MTIGSLFAGIGGLELGLERAGLGPTVWQVEQDAFCRQVLAKHWPDADRSVTDVREAGASNLEPVDIICGGFPCQDISYAGKGAGLAGERSGLWVEFARIVGEMGPRFVVVENVAALVTRGLDSVLGTLSDLGYDAIWTTVRASDVGAPHRRSRLFVVAYPDNAGLQRERLCRLLDGERQARGHDACGCDGETGLGDAEKQHRAEPRQQAHEHGRPGGRQAQPRLGGATHGLPRRLDGRWPACPHEPQHAWEAPRITEGCHNRRARLKSLGNAVVPQCAEVVGWVIRGLTA